MRRLKRLVWRAGTLGAALAVGTAVAATSHTVFGAVSIGIRYTNSAVAVSGCSGGFDLHGNADLHFASANARVNGEIPDGYLSEVANSADEAYVAGHGTLHSDAMRSPVALYAVDHGDFLNGVYRIELGHHAGVLVANTSSHQDIQPTVPGKTPGGHGAAGRLGDLPPRKNAVLISSSCSITGAQTTATPVDPSGGQNARTVSGTITTTYSRARLTTCRVGSLTHEIARTVLHSSDPLASGVLTLRVTTRANENHASIVTGSGTWRTLGTGKVIGHGSVLAARSHEHTDGIYLIHLADQRGLLALNAATNRRSARADSGGFGLGSSVPAQDTAVIAPDSC
jgi:hypothetical protein